MAWRWFILIFQTFVILAVIQSHWNWPLNKSPVVAGLFILSCHERHQAKEAGAFDGVGKFALVEHTNTGAAFADNLCLRRHKLPKNFGVFVVNNLNIRGTKVTLFFWLDSHVLKWYIF